jgi:hypothetical protein
MKLRMITGTALMITIGILFAADEHKAEVGPKGGRILEVEPIHAEFFVEKDRKISITFYDDKMKPIAATDQVVTTIAEAPEGKAKLEFEKKGDILISKTELPKGDGYQVVVQIKIKPDAKPQNFRIKLDLEECGGCKRAEYACACDHGKSEESGHHH